MARTASGNTPAGAQGDGADAPDTVSTANGEETLEPQTAQEQTARNAAPNDDTTAGDPRPVQTIDAPLVYNDGTPVTMPSAEDTAGTYNLTGPNGDVTVTSSARRDALLARGYTAK